MLSPWASRHSSLRAHLDTTTGTQPSGCRGVSIAPCCSVNAAFLFAEPRMLVVGLSALTRARARAVARRVGSSVTELLVAQRFDWIESGCLAGGIKPEKHPDEGAEHERDQDRIRRDKSGPLGQQGEESCRTGAGGDADQAAQSAEHNGFDEELAQDIAPMRADGEANADFASPLGDADEHDVHDANPADDER